IADRGLPQFAVTLRVVAKSVLDRGYKFLGSAINTHAWGVQIFVQRRDDHWLSGCQVFPNLNSASVIGKLVVLPPRQDKYVNRTDILRQLGIGFLPKKMNVGMRDVDQI